MNYELAKKLKDAGFPQATKDGKFLFGTPKEIITPQYQWGNEAYAPTLSELIEACEDNFFSLSKCMKPFCIEGYKWVANPFCDVHGFGYTPEEAVAALWLELHKKHV